MRRRPPRRLCPGESQPRHPCGRSPWLSACRAVGRVSCAWSMPAPTAWRAGPPRADLAAVEQPWAVVHSAVRSASWAFWSYRTQSCALRIIALRGACRSTGSVW